MDEKERKRLEKLERKREKDRRRYQAAREAGFTPKEAKSIAKSLRDKPELIGDIETVSPYIAKSIENLSELMDAFTDGLFEPEKKTRKKKPDIKIRKPGKKPLTDRQRQLNKEAGAFKRFLNRNPDLTQREALERFRKMGHTMSSERGAAIFREKRGLTKQEDKSTRFPSYPLDKNPSGNMYFQGRYMYMMAYTVLVSGTGDFEERYMTVASDEKLNKKERAQRVLDAYDQGELDQNEYYAAIYVDEDSIRTLYVVDTSKKTDRFAAFERKARELHPDLSQSQLYRMFRESKKKKGK